MGFMNNKIFHRLYLVKAGIGLVNDKLFQVGSLLWLFNFNKIKEIILTMRQYQKILMSITMVFLT
jgi:hypothetical protein